MRKISFVLFSFIKQREFYISFPAVTQFRCKGLFIMVEQLTFGSEADDIVLPHGIQLEEHLVIIIATVHGKSCFTKQGVAPIHSRECGIVNRGKVPRRMNLGKDTDRMIVAGKHRGFGYMIAFFIDIFCGSAFGTITYPAKRFKFITVRVNNIAVVDMDSRLSRPSLFNLCEISFQSFSGSALGKML